MCVFQLWDHIQGWSLSSVLFGGTTMHHGACVCTSVFVWVCMPWCFERMLMRKSPITVPPCIQSLGLCTFAYGTQMHQPLGGLLSPPLLSVPVGAGHQRHLGWAGGGAAALLGATPGKGVSVFCGFSHTLAGCLQRWRGLVFMGLGTYYTLGFGSVGVAARQLIASVWVRELHPVNLVLRICLVVLLAAVCRFVATARTSHKLQ